MTTSYGNTATPKTRANGLAVAGLVCGVVGIFLFNYILGPLAIIFGGVGLRNAHRGASHRGMALASIILGVLDIVVFVVVVAVASSNGGIHWRVGG